MNFLRRLALQEKKLDDSSRRDVVEIARVPDMLPSLFPSWSGLGPISTPVVTKYWNIIAVCEIRIRIQVISAVKITKCMNGNLGRATELVFKFVRRKNYFDHTEIRTPNRAVRSPSLNRLS